jgi:hypothetical protein
MKKNYNLFLDDFRTPLVTFEYKPLTIYKTEEWVIVRNYKEFTSVIQTDGLPDIISFDHDLADEHYTPRKYWGNYEKSKKYQRAQNYKEKTGYDCVVWLVDYCINNNKPLPLWVVHSMNPVGADNINNYLLNYIEKKSTFTGI